MLGTTDRGTTTSIVVLVMIGAWFPLYPEIIPLQDKFGNKMKNLQMNKKA